MRLDMFLKISRLVSRRAAAQELCDAGLVFLNGNGAKSSKEVKAGDEIEIRRRNRITSVKVREVPHTKQVSKSQAVYSTR
jgi:ribosome-associated heat shock protein Hsp15